jgi:L-fuculose-phosphate aldolase
MNEAELRAELTDCAHRLYQRGLVVAFEGNLSARLPQTTTRAGRSGWRWLLSPSRRCKAELSPRDFLRLDEHGRADGPGHPSSEWPLHLGIYRHLPEARAVIHAHAPHCTAFACQTTGLGPLLQPELLQLLGGPVPLAPYSPPGGHELFHSIQPFLANSPVILLANHGVVAISRESVREAFHFLEQVEQVARITYLARQLGSPRPLTADEQRQVRTA